MRTLQKFINNLYKVKTIINLWQFQITAKFPGKSFQWIIIYWNKHTSYYGITSIKLRLTFINLRNLMRNFSTFSLACLFYFTFDPKSFVISEQ